MAVIWQCYMNGKVLSYLSDSINICKRECKLPINIHLHLLQHFSFYRTQTKLLEKMMKPVVLSLLFAFLVFTDLHPVATSITLEPKKSCPYTVIIKTSCSSTTYTRDQISLAYGDAHGSEVYAKRLDDPVSKTFERCSTDKFHINGPCVRNICYLNLLRNGSDGWKPEFVKINGPYTNAVTFHFNVFLPNQLWFGHNLCHGATATSAP